MAVISIEEIRNHYNDQSLQIGDTNLSVSNGDWNANYGKPQTATIQNDWWLVMFNTGVSGSIRINGTINIDSDYVNSK